MIHALGTGIAIFGWLAGPLLAVGIVTWFFLTRVVYRIAWGMGTGLFVYLTAPGVMVHELGHAFMCVLTGGSIREMKLFSPSEDGTLGYVLCSQKPTHPALMAMRGLLVSVGPILSCSVALYFFMAGLFGQDMLSVLFSPSVDASGVHGIEGMLHVVTATWDRMGNVTGNDIPYWKTFMIIYSVFTFATHMELSPQDLRVGAPGLVILFIASMAISLLLAPFGDALDSFYGVVKQAGVFQLAFLSGTMMLETAVFVPFAVFFWMVDNRLRD